MAGKQGTKDEEAADGLRARIRAVAYERWRSQGSPGNTALDDWLFAESSVLSAEAQRKKKAAIPRKRVSAPKAA